MLKLTIAAALPTTSGPIDSYTLSLACFDFLWHLDEYCTRLAIFDFHDRFIDGDRKCLSSRHYGLWGQNEEQRGRRVSGKLGGREGLNSKLL